MLGGLFLQHNKVLNFQRISIGGREDEEGRTGVELAGFSDEIDAFFDMRVFKGVCFEDEDDGEFH